MDSITKEFKALYHKGKQGETRVWKIWTEDNVIKTRYGVLNGEMITSEKKAFGKNLGKKNETTDTEQAQSEAQSMWTFKKERKYSESEADAQEPLLLPMLAKEFDPKKAIYPAYIQPKLDGVRCLAYWDGPKIKLISRAGKEWTVPSHIADQVATILPPDCMFDGELYIHGKSCQTITSYVKKLRPETLEVQYHIYDMPIVNGKDDLNFEERNLALNAVFENVTDNDKIAELVVVETLPVESSEEVKTYETSIVANGYEGAILRNSGGYYLFGYRSKDLMKVKTFQDAEFVVLSVRDGDGKFEGCAIFQCRNNLNDLTFECTMATTMEEKKKQFDKRDNYIGKKLTVKFFDRTDDNLPRFPVGKMFRDEKDLG